MESSAPSKRQNTGQEHEATNTVSYLESRTFETTSPELSPLSQQLASSHVLFSQENELPCINMPKSFLGNSSASMSFDPMPHEVLHENDISIANFDGAAFLDMPASEYSTEVWGSTASSERTTSQVAPEFQIDACSSGPQLSQLSPESGASRHRPIHSDRSSRTGSGGDWVRSQKRRRTSRSWTSPYNNSPSPFSMDQAMISNSNSQMISTSLLQIYHDVLEHNLSCWLTEVTCPFRASQCDVDRTNSVMEWGSSWTNRILRRTLSLDRAAQSSKLIHLTKSQDQAAVKAIHLAIMAFATQWSQGSRRQKERYSPLADAVEDDSPESYFDEVAEEFDRNIQRNLWEQAKRALQEVADVESYRVACAELIFGLTQKPLACRDEDQTTLDELDLLLTAHEEFDPESTTDEIANIIAKDGPPIYMERAARKMHALRYRYDAERRGLIGFRNRGKKTDALSLMGAEDRGTVGLLYWLAVMFDTVSSSMSGRPLVVTDVDSQHDDAPGDFDVINGGRWNIPLFIQDSLEKPNRKLTWPCSYQAAAEAVTKSAPVKVLLYRHVSYLQNIMRRGGHGEEVEEIIRNTTSVYRYWNMT